MNFISAMNDLPHNLYKSSYVDILLLLNCLKPGMRLHCINEKQIREIEKWAIKYNFDVAIHHDNFIYITWRDSLSASKLMMVDNSLETHTYTLGRMLGYPKCCSKFIAKIGEDCIDSLEEKIETWIFKGKYELINPNSYLEGSSLISHLPCSNHCHNSLKIAMAILNIIKQHAKEQSLSRWHRWLTWTSNAH